MSTQKNTPLNETARRDDFYQVQFGIYKSKISVFVGEFGEKLSFGEKRSSGNVSRSEVDRQDNKDLFRTQEKEGIKSSSAPTSDGSAFDPNAAKKNQTGNEVNRPSILQLPSDTSAKAFGTEAGKKNSISPTKQTEEKPTPPDGTSSGTETRKKNSISPTIQTEEKSVPPDGTLSENDKAKIVEFGRPISLSGARLVSELYLGKVIFYERTCTYKKSLTIVDCDSGFEIQYARERLTQSKQKNAAEDVALIARLFLLSTVSKLKEEMRLCLKELTEGFKQVDEININRKPKNDIAVEKSDALSKNLLAQSTKAQDEAKNPFRELAEILVNLDQPDPSKKVLPARRGIKNFIVKALWYVEHCLSRFVNYAIKNDVFKLVVIAAAVLVVAGLFYGLLQPIFGLENLPHVVLLLIKVTLLLLAVFFALLALNFKNIEDRVHDKILEETNEKLGKILSELTQTNANVASLNTLPQAVGHVPELLLRHFDEVLHTKETVAGLEKVILARQREVTAQVHHVKEHQERARRAATAAAGGVFTGFFTFEVGERVFKFMHLIHGQDERSMFFWLTTEAQQFANPDLVNAKKRMPPEMMKEAHGKCVTDNPNTHLTACKAIELKLDPAHIQDHFMKQYQQSEMQAYGILLSITLVVSLIAAAIGWRKPAEEQAGGHGGHH
jgi:uncharacterized membrane protein